MAVTFNDVNINSQYHVLTDESQIHITPEKDYEFVEIPGRSGDLLFDNGRFKNTVIPIPCIIKENFRTNYTGLMNFLLSTGGYKRLRFSSDPDCFRVAVFKNSVQPETWERNKSGQFTLEFDCKPQRFLDSGDQIYAQTSTSWTLTNPTSFNSKPFITFRGNGTITIGSYTITVSGRSSSDSTQIDCELMTCSYNSANLAQYVTLSNGYPVLVPGNNLITYSSDSSAITPFQITPRWYEV